MIGRFSKLDLALWSLLFTVAVLFNAGCATTADGIGAAALSIDTTANIIADECGNPTPQDGCLPTSLITTQQAYEARVKLQEAQDLVLAANAALVAGEGAEASGSLSQAQAVLASIKATLISLGVEQ